MGMATKKRGSRLSVARSLRLGCHKPIVAFVILLWCGILLGALTHTFVLTTDAGGMTASLHTISSSWNVSTVLATAFWWLLTLELLFLFGLSAFGCPLIAAALLVIGFRLGLDHCQWYQYHGLLALLLAACLPSLCFMTASVGLAYAGMKLSLMLSNGALALRARPITARKECIQCCIWLLIGVGFVCVGAVAQTGIPILLGL